MSVQNDVRHTQWQRTTTDPDVRPPPGRDDDARAAAQRAALEKAETELRDVAKKGPLKNFLGRSGGGESPRPNPQARTAEAQARAAEAERVGRAVANHLGQGFNGMVRHHL